jgi:hypothetical protein
MRRLFGAAILAAALTVAVPLGGCSLFGGDPTATPATTQETVTKAYATAEAAVTIAAKGLTKAVQMGGITAGSDTAKAIQKGLDAASSALDAANAYMNAGLYDQAQSQIDNANKSIDGVNVETGAANG